MQWHPSILHTHRELSVYLFIYSFLAVLGLCCYTWAFSSCSKQGLLSSCGARASHCGGFSCCGAQALGHVGSVVVGCTGLVALWHVKFPRPGVEPMSPALAGGFLTTGPPGKSRENCFKSPFLYLAKLLSVMIMK